MYISLPVAHQNVIIMGAQVSDACTRPRAKTSQLLSAKSIFTVLVHEE